METNNKNIEHPFYYEEDEYNHKSNFSDCKVLVKTIDGKEIEYHLEHLVDYSLRLMRDKELFNWFLTKDKDKYGEKIRKKGTK